MVKTHVFATVVQLNYNPDVLKNCELLAFDNSDLMQ